ncbi:MAG: response regulator [Nitrospirota bacterium]|nr:response regulator [Nitrospirota bacterium]
MLLLSHGEQVMAGEKILNIDDSPTVQRLIEMILASQGYKVVLASDGEEGIAKAKSERPELILVDFVMPKMNGYQVCKTLKDDPEFRDTPIILVTSKGDKVGSKFVDTLGITEYFTKPFQPEELLSKIREVLDKKAEEAAAARAAMAAKARSAPAAAPAAAAPQGLEAMIANIVRKALDEFAATTLPALIRQELGRGGAGEDTGVPAPGGIRGNLAAFRIIELMQMLALQRHTGRLVITRKEGRAEIFFKEGAVAFAGSTLNGSLPGVDGLLRKTCRVDEDGLQHALRIAGMTGQPIDGVLAQERLMDQKAFASCLRRHTEAVVFKAMAWTEGDFVFDREAPPVFANPVAIKVDDLILEGTRRADEWILIQQKIPNLSVVFEPLIGNAEELTRRGLSAADLKVFSMVDGRRSVQDIVDVAMMADFEVAKSLFILLSVGLIRKKK